MITRRISIIALVTCFALGLLTMNTQASDWIGVYARIDKVVFEPNEASPERIQIWGAFVLATKEDRNNYDPAARGYLYYAIKPGQEDACRKEWADLKRIAGTDAVIGLGVRNRPSRLRKAGVKPTDPDVYPVGSGLVKMSDRGSEYGPIRELRSLPRK